MISIEKILENKLVINKIKEQYGLDNIEISKFIGGFSSYNYLIRNRHEKLVLKLILDRNNVIKQLKETEHVLIALNDFNIPTACPLKTKENLFHIYFKEYGFFIILFPFIPGTVLHKGSLGTKNFKSLSKVIRKFHDIGNRFPIKLKHAKDTLPSPKEIEEKTNQIKDIIAKNPLEEETNSLAINLINKKNELIKNIIDIDLINKYLSISNDLVHGDFHNENLLFDEKGNVTAILDFEYIHFGKGIEDIINFILFACCPGEFEKDNLKTAQDLIKSYNHEIKTTCEDIKFGTHYALYRLLNSFFLETELYTKKNLFFIQLLKRDLKTFSFFEKNLENFIKALCNSD